MGTDGNGRSVTYGGMGGQSPGAAGAPGQSATFVPDPNTGGAGGGGAVGFFFFFFLARNKIRKKI